MIHRSYADARHSRNKKDGSAAGPEEARDGPHPRPGRDALRARRLDRRTARAPALAARGNAGYRGGLDDEPWENVTQVFFHVAEGLLSVGHVIEPGLWGAKSRVFRPGGPKMPPETFDCILWEIALEASRSGYNALLPSRLDCVFACETANDAFTFRAKFRPTSRIYIVEPLLSSYSHHRGDYDIITAGPKWGGYVDYLPANALKYWSEPPFGMVEVLIGGAVRVIGLVPNGLK